MNEQNFSFENRPERGYLYALLAKLNQMGRDNLLIKNIETKTNTPTTYEIMDYILGERTAEQYCLHYYKDKSQPISLNDFITPNSENGIKINTNTSNRINNAFTVEPLVNGGYIYYLTKADVEFYSNGFKGGFSLVENNSIPNYKLYKSNQNISKYVEIEIKKETKEDT